VAVNLEGAVSTKWGRELVWGGVAAVDAGQTDLRALGFWRLLAKVKADPVLAHHWAEQAGRIELRECAGTQFEQRVVEALESVLNRVGLDAVVARQ